MTASVTSGRVRFSPFANWRCLVVDTELSTNTNTMAACS